MPRFIKFLRCHLPETLLFLIVLILCLRNYTPGTFLTGWDNLHPEFNIFENIKRSIFSVWQESQGLGLLAGMAHASDLVRQLIILPFTFFLPLNFIRYLWHFSMIFLGTFGIYTFAKNVLLSHHSSPKFPSLVAALFYLLNFASVQYFYFAFDPYSTFWGFFPWLLYFLIIYLEKPSRSNFLKLLLINLLATPSFYVQTLFVVYFICVFLVLILNRKNIFVNLKTICLIIFLNAFWLLPNLYFVITRVSVTQHSLQNLMVTDQFVEENQYRGTLQSFGLLQGQYYDIKEYLNDTPRFIMSAWHNHFSSFPVQTIAYFLILWALTGLFIKNSYKKYLLAILLFAAVGFLCSTFPFSILNNLFREFPVINQIFRNSFTKLLVPLVFSLSLLLSLSLSALSKFSLAFIPLIFVLSWPSFSGQFINPGLRTNIPSQYFELQKYLNSQDSSKRILNLPQYNFWGWYRYKWGYTGSGFLWYGLSQPITDRTFDVWDNHLENLYWQLHYALIARNSALFSQLLTQYNISYLLFDSNLSFTDSYNSGKLVLENQKLVDETPVLKLEKQFGSLKLYAVTPTKSSVTAYSQLPNINQSQNFSYQDHPFTLYSNYLTDPTSPYSDTFPFNNLFSNHPDQITDIASDNDTATITSPDSKYVYDFAVNWTHCQNAYSPLPLTLTAKNQEESRYFSCGDNIELSQSYLLKIDSKNLAGRPLLLKVFSLAEHRLIIDTKINPSQNPSYFVIPPIYPFDTGLGINLSSLSLSDNKSINQINQVELTNFSWKDISSKHFNNPGTPSSPVFLSGHQFNQTFYRVNLPSGSNLRYLALNQSYDPGWLAYSLNGLHPQFLTHHAPLNGWANSWQLPTQASSQPLTIYLLYWPQLLEYFGFFLIIPAFILYFFHLSPHSSHK